jgi:hypothetical protein
VVVFLDQPTGAAILGVAFVLIVLLGVIEFLDQPREPCSVPKLSRGPMAWRFSAAQAIRRYSLITPPTTRSRRIGLSSGMTHAGSWLGGR